MAWSPDKQARLDWLRARELAGALNDEERAELGELMGVLEAEEAEVFGPALARMREEIRALQHTLDAVQTDNEDLARRLAQEEQLAADSRRL